MGPLGGKRALVCGGTQGIGKACAFEFARLGAQVTILARNEEALRRVRDELAAAAGTGARGGAPPHAHPSAGFQQPEAAPGAGGRHVQATGPFEVPPNKSPRPPPGAVRTVAATPLSPAF